MVELPVLRFKVSEIFRLHNASVEEGTHKRELFTSEIILNTIAQNIKEKN